MLLFVAGTIRHRDRKQILIIIWTHRGEKKKKITHGSQQNDSELQNCKTRWLFVSTSRSQECGSSYDSRWGWGGEWHHRLCSHLNSDTVAPCVSIHPTTTTPTTTTPCLWSLDCARLCLFFPPQRIPPFLFLLLSSCLRMKWRKWHSISWWMVLDPWNLFLWGSHGTAFT